MVCKFLVLDYSVSPLFKEMEGRAKGDSEKYFWDLYVLDLSKRKEEAIERSLDFCPIVKLWLLFVLES